MIMLESNLLLCGPRASNRLRPLPAPRAERYGRVGPTAARDLSRMLAQLDKEMRPTIGRPSRILPADGGCALDLWLHLVEQGTGLGEARRERLHRRRLRAARPCRRESLAGDSVEVEEDP